jgi:hypothetical protein
VTPSSVKVNGKPAAGPLLTRTWRDGDTVAVRTPFLLRAEQALGDPKTQTLFFGPVNLVARDPRTTFLDLGLYRNAALSGDLLPSFAPVPGKPLHFRLGDVEFAPFFEGTEDPTHAYFHRAEPTVVFGGLDSGVANPAGAGTTLLDDIWAGAPFATKEALVRQVRTKVDAWRLGSVDAARVLATARRANYLC